MSAQVKTEHKTIPPFLYPLFWEYDPATISLDRHAHLLMSRIMERGSWEAMRWLQRQYSREELAAFLQARGIKYLPPRELNFWALICGIPDETRRQLVKEARTKKSTWTQRCTPRH